MADRSKWLHPRDALLETIQRIYAYRMTTTSGGNLSIRDGDCVWITPARVDKGNLQRSDIICVNADGSYVGPHPPSSELPFHLAIYKARPDIQALVHAHPVALVSFSLTGQVPDTRLFHSAWRVCGTPGLAPYALPGSTTLGDNIAQIFAEGHNCVMLENHGVVVGGRDLNEAFARFETLEFAAKTIIKAARLGPVHYLSEQQLQATRPALEPLPTANRPPIQTAELELRKQISDFLRRAYRQRLVICSGGTFSARVTPQSFLITPHGRDRWTVEADDLVLITNGQAETGGSPSYAARLHAAIYNNNPEVQVIINAYSVNATAFSVTGASLESRAIPESYIFMRDVARIPFGMQFDAPDKVAQHISLEQPVALLANDGLLVVGKTVLEAFDRLEVTESTAEAIINAASVGPVCPMSDAVIDELKQAFFPK